MLHNSPGAHLQDEADDLARDVATASTNITDSIGDGTFGYLLMMQPMAPRKLQQKMLLT
jgi:hypothetical protein